MITPGGFSILYVFLFVFTQIHLGLIFLGVRKILHSLIEIAILK